ncbi:hypothetical protein L1987_03270 [Smallanthus sonchifolius]|uniref:Uncharacterized protein n=1 Tax=Smallanthus sonchifolius TaxID=185202 RepID=A0ACB9KA56_9ASTR|nr:hypothetical protein L1987_03270 [Smallanthus sonchifolius]
MVEELSSPTTRGEDEQARVEGTFPWTSDSLQKVIASEALVPGELTAGGGASVSPRKAFQMDPLNNKKDIFYFNSDKGKGNGVAKIGEVESENRSKEDKEFDLNQKAGSEGPPAQPPSADKIGDGSRHGPQSKDQAVEVGNEEESEVIATVVLGKLVGADLQGFDNLVRNLVSGKGNNGVTK